MAAQAQGDGATLLLTSAAITYDPSLHDKLPYDTLHDLAPVAMIGTTPNLLVGSGVPRHRGLRDRALASGDREVRHQGPAIAQVGAYSAEFGLDVLLLHLLRSGIGTKRRIEPALLGSAY
jgi:hypothetical protein